MPRNAAQRARHNLQKKNRRLRKTAEKKALKIKSQAPPSAKEASSLIQETESNETLEPLRTLEVANIENNLQSNSPQTSSSSSSSSSSCTVREPVKDFKERSTSPAPYLRAPTRPARMSKYIGPPKLPIIETPHGRPRCPKPKVVLCSDDQLKNVVAGISVPTQGTSTKMIPPPSREPETPPRQRVRFAKMHGKKPNVNIPCFMLLKKKKKINK